MTKYKIKINYNDTMWNPFKKSKEYKADDGYQDITEYSACVNAGFIYKQIYDLFKERINELYTLFNERGENELKEGYNFILLQKEPIKICDNKELNESLIREALYDTNKRVCERIPELRIVVEDIEMITDRNIYIKKYYVYTIKISHDDVIELYHIKFRVKPSPQEINNGNEICVTVYSVDKNIYKLI